VITNYTIEPLIDGKILNMKRSILIRYAVAAKTLDEATTRKSTKYGLRDDGEGNPFVIGGVRG
jgi:hypothetical protein